MRARASICRVILAIRCSSAFSSSNRSFSSSHIIAVSSLPSSATARGRSILTDHAEPLIIPLRRRNLKSQANGEAKPMGREEVIGVRLTSDEREVLETAAEAHSMPPSTLSRQIVLEWLQCNGWMGLEVMRGVGRSSRKARRRSWSSAMNG